MVSTLDRCVHIACTPVPLLRSSALRVLGFRDFRGLGFREGLEGLEVQGSKKGSLPRRIGINPAHVWCFQAANC